MPPTETESAAARLERLAERYVPGCGAVRVEGVGSGLTNRSYRVTREGRHFSLRITAPRAAGLGLDRRWECRVLNCAAQAGLAPLVERCAPGAGILVMRWAQGSSWTLEQASSADHLAQVAALVRRVQGLPLPQRPRVVGPAQWIAFYRKALERREAVANAGLALEARAAGDARAAGEAKAAGEARAAGDARVAGDAKAAREARAAMDESAQALLRSLTGDPPPPAPVLCHGDLHVQNLLISAAGAPVLLDWEYAHVADPWWDLAGWACNADLTDGYRDLLLREYLGREAGPRDRARLRRLAWLYDYICLLWSELYLSRPPAGDGPPDRDAIAARAQRLRERLHDSSSGCAGQVPAH